MASTSAQVGAANQEAAKARTAAAAYQKIDADTKKFKSKRDGLEAKWKSIAGGREKAAAEDAFLEADEQYSDMTGKRYAAQKKAETLNRAADKLEDKARQLWYAHENYQGRD